MFHSALFLNLLFVAAITWASYRHFERDGQEPRGASALSLATGLGTVVNVWLALAEPRAGAYISLTAIALTILALAFFLAAIHASRNGGLSLAFSECTPSAVVDNGVYRHIRHPFYASYCLYWLSWVLLTNAQPLAAAIAVAMIASYVIAARKEERLLSARHGEAYRSLMLRTWRLVPGLY